MGELQKCDYKLCNKCKYSMRFGFASYNAKATKNIACNYIGIEEQGRVFRNGERRLPEGYCDKFEEGKPVTQGKIWSSDRMTIKSRGKVRTGIDIN